MSEEYTGNPANNPTSITLADDGEPKPVATVNVGLEGVMDKAAHANWPEQDATKIYPLALRTLRRVQIGPWFYDMNECTPSLIFDVDGVTITDGLIISVQGTWAYKYLAIPSGAQLLSVDCAIKPASGHGALPAGDDRFALQLALGAGVEPATAFAHVYDTSATVAAYEAAHVVTCNVSPWDVDNSIGRLLVVVHSEKGVNGLDGVKIIEVGATFQITGQDPGAA